MPKGNGWNIIFGIAGCIWLLAKLFEKEVPSSISGLQNAQRKLIPFINKNGKNTIKDDLSSYDNNEAGEVIRLIMDARLRPSLEMPIWKPFKGRMITGEFRDSQWRILAYKISEFEGV